MRLEWICDGCHSTVANGTGYILVDECDAYRREREWRDYREAKTRDATDDFGGRLLVMSEVMALPGPARWEVWHRKCDPNPDRYDYTIDVERCRTLRELLDWNVHLTEKSWVVRHTDWARFIHRHLTGGYQ